MFVHATVQSFFMLDPRLQSLRLVAWYGGVTAAAEAAHYTPSAVSAQLRSLANDVGAPLLERQGRGVRLTDAAQVLLEHADEVAAAWEAVCARVQSGTGAKAGAVTMAGFSTAASTLLPEAVRELLRQHPGTVARIVEADPLECFDMLVTGQADLAVVVATDEMPALSDRRFEQLQLGNDPLELLVHARHRLADRESVSLAEAAGEPWIMDRPGRPYRQLVLSSCVAAGFTPEIAHESVEWETGAALVHAGFGVALVPRLAHLPSGYAVQRVPLHGDPRPARHIRAAVRAGARSQPRIVTALDAMIASAVLAPAVTSH